MGLPVMENFHSSTKVVLHSSFSRCLPEKLCLELYFCSLYFVYSHNREAGCSKGTWF